MGKSLVKNDLTKIKREIHFTTHYSLLTTHYSLLTTHYSLLASYFLLLASCILLLASNLSAQVIIKEKVEINPQRVILSKTPADNHTIRVDIQWTPASLPGWILFYDLECDQQDYYSPSSNTGTNTFSHTSLGYENYPIQFRFGSLDPNQPTITGSYQLYYDEVFIRSGNFTANKASYTNFAYYNIYYQSPVLTDYTFAISGSEICSGSYNNFYIETVRNCNTTAEINTEQDSITLTIETGKEFVSFYKNNQKKDTVTFMYHELGSVYLRQDSIYTGTASINVNIKSDWTGIIKYQQLVINPQEQFQIRVPDQPIIVFSGGVGGLKIEPYSSSICPPYISENLRYTALIKKGSSRGLLYDYDTGQSGDTLTNLTPQGDGEKYLDFITEGEILSKADTVIVKVFTKDKNIDTTEAAIIIYPNDIDVQIIPPVISQGDTARVVLKKRGQNGLEDFAADKVFNVEIVQGLEYGWILDSLSNDTLTAFENIPQGFKIIAKDSTGIDSARIRIKVSTEESGFPVASMIRNNTKTNNNEVVDDNENKKNDDEIITPDWIIPGPILLEGFGDVVVGNVCATLPKCTENNAGKKPNFEIMDFPDGTDGNYKCKNVSGITYMLWSENEKKLFLPIEIENCYDENANVIQFGIKNDLITLRAIVTACEDVIVNQGYSILYNTTELKTKVPQNLRALSQLYSDLDIFLDYFTNENPSSPFYPIELAWEHEFQHKKNYINEIFNVVNKDFDYLDYSRLDVSCNKYSELNDVVNEMKSNFEKRFSYFEKESIKFQFKVWGKKDGTPKEIENYRKNEINTHNAIAKKVIDKYKTEIKKLILNLPK